ncbi:hypothetical protein [Bartonella schoenbuchensis]|uniref:hypothetical protein n=1 Tax=Bartonella schoenbuchensis TaxID=165694 RepID=UPI0031455566
MSAVGKAVVDGVEVKAFQACLWWIAVCRVDVWGVEVYVGWKLWTWGENVRWMAHERRNM